MLKRFTQLVSKFPFAGKLAIRPAFRNFVRANGRKRHGAFAWLSSILGFMVIGHGRQAWVGLQAMRLAYFAKTKVFWHVVFAGYTAANIAVTIAQAYLLCWSLYVFATRRHTGLIAAADDYTGREIVVMLVVTLGGQGLFIYGHGLL